MSAGNAKLLPWQRHLLWAVIMISALTLLILGIVLTVRSVSEEDTSGDQAQTPCPGVATQAQPTISSTTEPHPYPVDSPHKSFRFAAVSSGADPCNTMATKIMAIAGGSAVDAAIVTSLCVGISNLQFNGIGGGNFMTIYERPNNETEKVLTTIFARERAPAASTEDMFQNISSLFGGMAIAIPGEIKGFHYAWQRFGRIPWKDLFQPVIEFLKNGVPINRDVAFAIEYTKNRLSQYPSLSDMLTINGAFMQEGDVFYNNELVQTLEIIAEDPLAFYNKSHQLAIDIVDDISEAGGIITLDDLANYAVIEKPAISVHLSNGNYTVYSPTAPSGGLILLFILNVLDGYNFTAEDISDTENTVLTIHRIIETFKYAYSKRSELGDEDFVPAVSSLIANLTSEAYAEEIRNKIDDNRTYEVLHYEPSFQFTPNHGTSHMSVLSADGSAVSLTSTINFLFGSHVRGNRTGIIFNDEMDDFSSPGANNVFGVPPSPANFIRPGKIPLSSMSPIIVRNSVGDVVLVTGGAGGTTITTGTLLVTIWKLWFGLPLKKATDYPRFHHQLVPNSVGIGEGFDEAVKQGLVAKGHEITALGIDPMVQSIYNECEEIMGLYSSATCITAVSDGRTTGHPDGY